MPTKGVPMTGKAIQLSDKQKGVLVAMYAALHTHGLGNWQADVRKLNPRTLGLCMYKQRLVLLNSWYAEEGEAAEVADTILHEIAHAYAYTFFKARGHGSQWKRACSIVGCLPAARKNVAYTQTISGASSVYRYVAGCSNTTCGVLYNFERKPRKLYKALAESRCTCNRCSAPIVPIKGFDVCQD